MISKHKNIFLLALLILAAFLRLILLDRLPAGINDDELHLVLNSKSIFYNLKNIDGSQINFSSFDAPSLLFAPIIGPLPANLFTARLPYALISILSVFLIFKITAILTKNHNLALITALVSAINPWSIYVGRTAFDAPIAVFFFLLCLFLMIQSKPKFILLSIIPGFLAFNSYIGTKIIFFPFVFLTTFILWKYINQKNGLHYLIIVIFSLALTVNYIISLSHLPVGSRLSELSSPNSQQIADQVNTQRRQSLQSPFKLLITNKYTIYFRNFLNKYLYNFSTDILFITGDHTATGSLWIHGYFYYIDALFLILGVIYLYINFKNVLILISSLIFLSPIPEAIRSDALPAYVFHSALLYPFLTIFIGAGVLFFWQLAKNNTIRLIFILLYFFSFINFLDIYFIKAPVYQSEAFPVSHRIISRYLSSEVKNNRQIYFLTREPEVMFRNYLFYNNLYKKSNINLLNKIFLGSKNNLTFDQTHFIDNQEYLPKGNDFTLIYDSDNFVYDVNVSKIYIKRFSDVGKVFSIYRGYTCNQNTLESFTHNLNFFDLDIEKLSRNQFCQKFITS